MQHISLKTSLMLVLAMLMVIPGSALASERLVIGSAGEVDNLDPRIATDVRSFERINTMFEPLVVFNTGLGLEPRLAESWEFSDDALSITFRLREGVMFHHGKTLTPEDVAYTFEWVLDEDNEALNRGLYTDIERIETDGDDTVIFHLSRPNSFLLNNIARMPIVPKDRGDDPDFADNPVGTGPFMFESLQRDDHMVLRAFEEYWHGRAYVDVLEFRPIPEDGTRLLALEGGEIDMYQGNIVAQELERLEADPSINVDRAPGAGYQFVGFNMRSEPLDDVRVRQAISYVIPREAIVERVLEGVGEPGVSMLLPDMPWFNPDVRRYTYDPERAQELLAEAGYPDGGFSLRIYSDTNSARMQIAEIMQAELAQLGIEATVSSEESSTVFQRFSQTEDYDLMVYAWLGQLDPDRAIYRQFTSDGSVIAYTYYSNTRVDELAERGQAVPPDSEASIEIYQEIQEILLEEVPYAYINYIEEVALSSSAVEGWEVHPYNAATYQNVHRIRVTR